jgi:predicted phosphate transport protein (TIGR00153 family)
MSLFFTKTKKLESEMDEYLDLVIKGGLIFKLGIKCYTDGQMDEFENHLQDLRKIEDRADDLRRNIEIKLYSRTLIPEARGDVLGLLESCDKVLNITTETLLEFSVEIPQVLPELKQDFLYIADSSISCLENTVSGIRAYFKNIDAVRDYVTKVQFYKKETNKIAERIKRTIFRTDFELSRKIHIRYFTFHIERIAELSEDVCDRLSIAIVKRFE